MLMSNVIKIQSGQKFTNKTFPLRRFLNKIFSRKSSEETVELTRHALLSHSKHV